MAQSALAHREAPVEIPPGITGLDAPPAAPATMFTWQDAAGAPHLTVVVKQTLRITESGLGHDPEPLPVLLADDYQPDRPLIPPRLESDCAPFKPRADVVLVGRAYAPGGRPVTQLVAGFRVGTLRRAIVVIGDRRWRTRRLGRPVMDDPRPFTTMDLSWERAFGGATVDRLCLENPVGRGIAADRESLDGTALPNLESPDARIVCWTDRPAPAGVGFVGRGWSPRRSLAGVSHGFHNAAPVPQQLDGFLRGDEEVELVNLTPEGHLAFRLLGRRPRVRVARWSTPSFTSQAAERDAPMGPVHREHDVVPALDTRILLPDERRVCIVHRAVCALTCADGVDVARVTVRV